MSDHAGSENPFTKLAQIATASAQDSPVEDVPVQAPPQIPGTDNPFLAYTSTAVAGAATDEQGFDDYEDEAFEESLADEVADPEPAPAPAADPAPEPAPAPESKPKRKRRTSTSVAPDSAQPKPVDTSDSDDDSDITGVALTKPADEAWRYLTDIINETHEVTSEIAVLGAKLETLQSTADTAAGEVVSAQQELDDAEKRVKEARAAHEASVEKLRSITDEGTKVHEQRQSLLPREEEVQRRKEIARTVRDQVSTYFTTITGGKSGTYGSVRVTFIDGTPHIEKVTGVTDPQGKDTE